MRFRDSTPTHLDDQARRESGKGPSGVRGGLVFPTRAAACCRDRTSARAADISKSSSPQIGASRELNEKARVPRLFRVENEFRAARREAELAYVRRLASDIEGGACVRVTR
jgi:hypothetical protein